MPVNRQNNSKSILEVTHMQMNDLTLGFVMSLAQNKDALERFSSFNDGKKQEILSSLHAINSRNEMRQFVDRLGKGIENNE